MLIDDIVLDQKLNRVQVIGHGREPMGQFQKNIFSDNIFLGFLNFMPTIGRFNNYWSAGMDPRTPSLYLQGDSGVPFRQAFSFIDLPKKKDRATIDSRSRKNTYASKVTLYGKAPLHLKLKAPANIPGSEVERLEGENFKWTYMVDKMGYNSSHLEMQDG